MLSVLRTLTQRVAYSFLFQGKEVAIEVMCGGSTPATVPTSSGPYTTPLTTAPMTSSPIIDSTTQPFFSTSGYNGMVWYGMVWYGILWFVMVWYGMANLADSTIALFVP